jgi:hypothetical protein
MFGWFKRRSAEPRPVTQPQAQSYLVVFHKEGGLRFVVLGLVPWEVRKQELASGLPLFGVWQLPLDMLKAYSLLAHWGWLPDTPISSNDMEVLLDKLRATGHPPTSVSDQIPSAGAPPGTE